MQKRGRPNPVAAGDEIIMRFTHDGVTYTLSAGKEIPFAWFLYVGACARLHEWLTELLRERPNLRPALLVLAGKPSFKPRLKAEILADAANCSPFTIWLLECEIEGLTAKRLFEIFRDCAGVPTRTAGWARITAKKNFVKVSLPEDALKGGEELLARLVAVAYAADHPNLFRGADPPDGTGSPASPQSSRTSYSGSNSMRRCHPKGRKRK